MIIPLLLFINTTTINHHYKLSSSSSFDNQQQRIPKIIHQTWFETITQVKHPNLIRIQNSWRATGQKYEYVFYDDSDARKIIKNIILYRF